MLVPLTAIVTTSLPLAAAMALCAKDRTTVHAQKKKSDKSSKSAAAHRPKSSRSHRSGSKSRRSKSRRSSKSGRSSKSSKRHGKSKSRRSKRSSKDKKNKSDKEKSEKEKSEKEKKEGEKAKDNKSKEDAKDPKAIGSSEATDASEKCGKNRRLENDALKKMGGKKSSADKSGKAKSQKSSRSNSAEHVVERSLKEEVAAIKHSTQLAVAPARLQYPTVGGVSTIEVKNNSGQRKAIKVKCSDNALYRVNPVHGFAEPHSSVKVDVLRLNGEEKTDKLVFLVANANNAVDAREVFAKSGEQREMMVVPLVSA